MEKFVGIDWATREHQVCLVSHDGKELEQRVFAHSAEGLASLVSWLRTVEDISNIKVAIETTNGLVVDALLEAGVAVFSINPKQLDRFRDRHTVAGAKDDRRDAFVLGASLRTDRDLFRRLDPDAAEIVELRELSRARDELVDDHKRTSSQLRELLLRFHPDLLALCQGANQVWLWDVLAKARAPKALRKLKAKELAEILRNRRIRRFTPTELEAALRKQVSTAPGVEDAIFRRIKLLLPLLQTTREQLTLCEQQLRELLEALPNKGHRDVSLLLSLPGLGTRLTAVIVSEANEPLTARDYQRLRAIAGAAPVTKATGLRKGPRAQVQMRRACNGRLRNALFHWARAAIPLDPRVRQHYTSLRQRGHSHGRALRGVADRLLRIAIGVLKSNRDYDPQCLTTA